MRLLSRVVLVLLVGILIRNTSARIAERKSHGRHPTSTATTTPVYSTADEAKFDVINLSLNTHDALVCREYHILFTETW